MDDLVVLSRDPLNAETPLARQVGSITPVAQHYVRSHFAAPAPPRSITFDGRVEVPFTIAAEEPRSVPEFSRATQSHDTSTSCRSVFASFSPPGAT